MQYLPFCASLSLLNPNFIHEKIEVHFLCQSSLFGNEATSLLIPKALFCLLYRQSTTENKSLLCPLPPSVQLFSNAILRMMNLFPFNDIFLLIDTFGRGIACTFKSEKHILNSVSANFQKYSSKVIPFKVEMNIPRTLVKIFST